MDTTWESIVVIVVLCTVADPIKQPPPLPKSSPIQSSPHSHPYPCIPDFVLVCFYSRLWCSSQLVQLAMLAWLVKARLELADMACWGAVWSLDRFVLVRKAPRIMYLPILCSTGPLSASVSLQGLLACTPRSYRAPAPVTPCTTHQISLRSHTLEEKQYLAQVGLWSRMLNSIQGQRSIDVGWQNTVLDPGFW